MENEEKAYCLIQEHLGEKIEYFQRKSVEKALLEMAAWKDEQFAKEKQQLIEKACEWLKSKSCCGYIEDVEADELIARFKKAMEE